MFTGLVEALAQVLETYYAPETEEKKIKLEKPAFFDDVVVGASIAVNGVCLTVTALDATSMTFTLSPETQRLTSLAALEKGRWVNLERALLAQGRLAGHYVQGHIDGRGTILSMDAEGEGAFRIKIAPPLYFLKYIVKKGFIALDGISLTVVETGKDWFTVMLIPHTLAHTVAQYYTARHGFYNHVNIELDILAKYTEKLLHAPL